MTKEVLVVDDEVGALTLIGIMLERGGYQVVKAPSGYHALDILDDYVPDLIILDVMMPGMDGITLCGEIRKTYDAVPIIILSARGDAAAIENGMSAGANDYLQKPILHNDLLSKINDILGED